MNRFSKGRPRTPKTGAPMLSALIFAGVFVLFVNGMGSLSSTGEAEQLAAVRDSITRAAVHCYAVEGAYPQSLTDLENRYGLRIDHDRYLVDYRSFASNLMPDITVLPLQ